MPSSGFGKSLRNKETDRPPFRVNIKNELQPQTGVEPGELRETDGGGRGESAAKGLKWGGGAFFSIR